MVKKNLKKELMARLADHPDVELKKSRFSEQEAFYFCFRELAHFDNEHTIDIRVTKKAISKHKLLARKDPRVHRRNPSSDWLEVTLTKEADLELAQEFFQISIEANKIQVRDKRKKMIAPTQVPGFPKRAKTRS